MQQNVPETLYRARFGMRSFVALILCISLVCSMSFPLLAMPQHAYAVTEETEDEPDELQQRVEQTAADYDAAVSRVEELEQQIEDNRALIAQLETELPEQQQRASEAMREQYKMQRETPGLVEMILGAENLNDFLVIFDYITHVQNSNANEINRLAQMYDQLQTTEDELAAAMDEAQSQQAAAEQALAEAQAAREEAQRRAAEEAARLAEEAARQAEEQAQQAESESDSASGESGASNESQSGTSGGSSSGSGSVQAPSSDGADWSSDKASFVAQWAPRINAYLAGSPLAGQGQTFASAAWDYGVDPRWSPAISYTESSKGAHCFLPYNAWGWGSHSWGSWEEAINAHVRGLARGYGYTISVAAAKKYCPPNWEHWYNTTSAQMNLI